jgi:hypothetical protein
MDGWWKYTKLKMDSPRRGANIKVKLRTMTTAAAA